MNWHYALEQQQHLASQIDRWSIIKRTATEVQFDIVQNASLAGKLIDTVEFSDYLTEEINVGQGRRLCSGLTISAPASSRDWSDQEIKPKLELYFVNH